MLIERLIWDVEPDNQDEFVALLTNYMREANSKIKRIYTPLIGNLGQIVAELEYENLSDWEIAWHEWKSPERAADVALESELATVRETTVWGLVE